MLSDRVVELAALLEASKKTIDSLCKDIESIGDGAELTSVEQTVVSKLKSLSLRFDRELSCLKEDGYAK